MFLLNSGLNRIILLFRFFAVYVFCDVSLGVKWGLVWKWLRFKASSYIGAAVLKDEMYVESVEIVLVHFFGFRVGNSNHIGVTVV